MRKRIIRTGSEVIIFPISNMILNLKMRELVTFCAICCLGGCEPQAKAHAGANLSVGNTRDMLIEAITQCLPFIGFPRTLNAISCINEVTAEK